MTSKTTKTPEDRTAEQLTTVVAGALGVDPQDPQVNAVVDALLKDRPWAKTTKQTVKDPNLGDLTNRAGVAELMGVGPRTVTEYAFRDPEFPKPRLERATLWAISDIKEFQKLRSTRIPGRPRGTVKKTGSN